MTMVSELRGSVDSACCVKSISRTENGEKLSLDISGEKGDHVVIDFDAPELLMGEHKRPDFLFVSNAGGSANSSDPNLLGRIVPIELSTGRSKSVKEIRKQLQAGLDWVDRRIDQRYKPSLVPVFVGRLDSRERGKIRMGAEKVRFRGKKKIIQIASNEQKLPKPTQQK